MNATPKSALATTEGIDRAKDVFELAFADADARVIERSRLYRGAFAKVFDNRAPVRVVMKTRGSAHHWPRRLQRRGHRVELLPAHALRPYVRGNKT